MSPLDAVADSTDWLHTPLAALSPLESALRCQVCKDFFHTPMITSCSHSFCSLCIRRCLSQEGRCPACRSEDQELKLRRNWALEEMVTSFVKGREGLLSFARHAARKIEEEEFEEPRSKKRRKVDQRPSSHVETRSTRSQSRRHALQASQENDMGEFEVADSEGGSEYEDDGSRHSSRLSPTAESITVPDDGLVACPICGKRMKNDMVFTHLDHCAGASSAQPVSKPVNQTTSSTTTITTTTTKPQHVSIAYMQPSGERQTIRLPTLAYSMLNESALRKKLKELGISNSGPKLLLQKRHTEWINLWNANCDSRAPKSKRELLSELEVWDRTQGRQILNTQGQAPIGVMAKDFDGQGWMKGNKSGFDDLIRKARVKQSHTPTSETPRGEAEQVGANDVSRHFRSSHVSASEGALENGVLNSHEYVDLTLPMKPPLDQQQSQSSQFGGVAA